MDRKYVFSDFIAVGFMLVFLIIGLVAVFAVPIVWVKIIIGIVLVLLEFPFVYFVGITCYDREGFYSISLFHKSEKIYWKDIIKAEHRARYHTHDSGAESKHRFLAVYTNEYFVEPEVYLDYKEVSHKPNQALSITGSEISVFSEYFTKYRPDLFIERHESAI